MKDFYVFVAAGVLLTAASALGVGTLRYRAIPMPLPAVEADADVEIRSISNSGSMVAVISNYRTNAALRGELGA